MAPSGGRIQKEIRLLGSPVDRICGKCGWANDSAAWGDMEACPACGAIYSKVDAHVAASAEKAMVDARSRVAAESKRAADAAMAAQREARATAARKATRQRKVDSSLICTACGSVGGAKNSVRGSTGMELLLWLLSLTIIMFPVAIIYSVWRMGSRHKKCGRCGSEQLVPVGTPAGRKLYAEFHPTRAHE